MDCKHCGRRLPRQPVLIVARGDGYIEVFGERGVDVHVARLPHCPAAEATAEDYVEAALPRRYRPLYFPSFRRATATTRPLLPSTIAEANQSQAILNGLNELAEDMAPADAPAGEEVLA